MLREIIVINRDISDIARLDYIDHSEQYLKWNSSEARSIKEQI